MDASSRDGKKTSALVTVHTTVADNINGGHGLDNMTASEEMMTETTPMAAPNGASCSTLSAGNILDLKEPKGDGMLKVKRKSDLNMVPTPAKKANVETSIYNIEEHIDDENDDDDEEDDDDDKDDDDLIDNDEDKDCADSGNASKKSQGIGEKTEVWQKIQIGGTKGSNVPLNQSEFTRITDTGNGDTADAGKRMAEKVDREAAPTAEACVKETEVYHRFKVLKMDSQISIVRSEIL